MPLKDEEINKLKSEIQDLNNKINASKEESTNFSSQIEDLNNIISQKETEIQELKNNLEEKEQLMRETSANLEKTKSDLDELKIPEIDAGSYSSEERITCPMCSAVGSNIKQVEDKTKVLSYIGHIPMYAKKNICKKCGYEF